MSCSFCVSGHYPQEIQIHEGKCVWFNFCRGSLLTCPQLWTHTFKTRKREEIFMVPWRSRKQGQKEEQICFFYSSHSRESFNCMACPWIISMFMTSWCYCRKWWRYGSVPFLWSWTARPVYYLLKCCFCFIQSLHFMFDFKWYPLNVKLHWSTNMSSASTLQYQQHPHTNLRSHKR